MLESRYLQVAKNKRLARMLIGLSDLPRVTGPALDQAAPLAGWLLPECFATLRRLLEARLKKHGSRDYVQVLRLLETFDLAEVARAIEDALQLGRGETFGGESHCEIEHLFYGQRAAAAYFHNEPCPGGQRIVFKSDSNKVTFAKDVVPTLPRECFAPLAPVFDFILEKCRPQSAS
jgi:hypothetical protein